MASAVSTVRYPSSPSVALNPPAITIQPVAQHRTEVRHALPTIDQHHREIAEHPARIMTPLPLLDRSQTLRQPPREPHLLGDLRDERAARMRHQTRSVRRDF